MSGWVRQGLQAGETACVKSSKHVQSHGKKLNPTGQMVIPKGQKMETESPRRQENTDLCSLLCGCEVEKRLGESAFLPTAG